MNIARQLTTRLAELLKREHCAMADFIAALADFDERRLWEQLEYTSLFWFLHRELGLPKSAAFHRMTAAQLVQRHPELLEHLRSGALCLTTLAELAKVLTPENLAQVLPRFFTLSAREAKEVRAALLPARAPPLRDLVTVVSATSTPTPIVTPAPASSEASASTLTTTTPMITPAVAHGTEDRHLGAIAIAGPAEPAALTGLPLSSGSAPNLVHANAAVPGVASAPSTPPATPPPAAFEVEPLTADLRRLHITVSKRLLDKIDAARDALSHSHPGASRDEIIEAALDLVLERAAKRRGLVKHPRRQSNGAVPAIPQTGRGSPGGGRDRYVPAEVRRAIWERDRGRCQWKMDGGGICGSTYRVELDHVVAFAKGGRIRAPEDGELLCKPHNDRHAREVFGDAWMDRFTRKRASGQRVAALRRSRR